jgi:hypothetical protein
MTVTVIGCAVLIGAALFNDPKKTITLVTAVVTVRGIAWLVTKITSINKDASEMINFAGWSLAGVSVVGLIKLATKGLPEIIQGFGKAIDGINSVAEWIEHLPIIGTK